MKNSGTPELFTAKGVCKNFGGVQALKQADLTVVSGEVHFLLGENGAGKSTLGKIAAGVHPFDHGELFLAGEKFAPKDPLEAQKHGVAMIFQELDLFPNLSVAENMAVNNTSFPEGCFVRRGKLHDFCRPFLERMGLDISPGQMVHRLSMGQMQLTAIARALSMNARLIVMDEPSSSLTDDAVDILFENIEELRKQGIAIIYVSHKMEELERIADRVTVMRDGETIATHQVDSVSVDSLIAEMAGREITFEARNKCHCTDTVMLQVEGLSTSSLQEVSLDVHAGEVLGVAGLVGSGRTEIGLALMGFEKVVDGTIELNGALFNPRSPKHAITSGIGMMPEDRKLEGLMMQMSVRENATLAAMKDLNRGGWILGGAEDDRFQESAKATMLKAPSATAPITQLSGGNQQKVLLSRWLMVDPDVFFLDDPTRGVDVGAKEDIYEIIDSLAGRGKAIIMVSSELPELLRCCDRILVMRDGKSVGCLDAKTTTQEEILHLAAASLEEEKSNNE